jgi:hypothetical protein
MVVSFLGDGGMNLLCRDGDRSIRNGLNKPA